VIQQNQLRAHHETMKARTLWNRACLAKMALRRKRTSTTSWTWDCS